MFARKILITKNLHSLQLPSVIKKEVFDKLIDIQAVEDEAKIKSIDILTSARMKKKLYNRKTAILRRRRLEEGYESGKRKAQKEMAVVMTDMAASSAQFVKDVESRIVDIVCGSVSEIVNGFDDKALVQEVVRKAVKVFEVSDTVTIWVSSSLKSQFAVGIEELVAPASLTLKVDENLKGCQCRIDNGRMVVNGDIEAQVGAIRAAMEKKIGEANRLY